VSQAAPSESRALLQLPPSIQTQIAAWFSPEKTIYRFIISVTQFFITLEISLSEINLLENSSD